MESHPINQHYVPKVLLKNFSSRPYHIWVYDKVNRDKNWHFIKERPISKVASAEYFYDKIPNDIESSYEYELAKIEKAADPIISKLIFSKKLSSISAEEKEILSFFITVQHLRTKSGLHYCKTISDDLEQKLSPFFKEGPNFDYKKLWFDNLESTPDFSKYILNKIWFLGECESKFYTSDHPVVLQNSTVDDPLRGTLGLDSYGIEIYMPLTDSLILCMFCEKLLNNYEGDTSPLDFNDEQVLNVNWLQYAQSVRFLFSSRNNFEMIDKLR